MASTVLIGATDVMPALRAQLEETGEALTFANSEAREALKAITAHRPPVVVLERLFAATSRGAALINRIRSDPSLTHVEVRVVSHHGDYVRTVPRPASVHAPAPAVVVAGPAAPGPKGEPEIGFLDRHGTRCAPRVHFCEGVEFQLDGEAARGVDMSTTGAQALYPLALRPDQKVRITIPGENETKRFRASVAWSRFEPARSPAQPHYRVGLEFIEADAEWLERYCDKNRG